MKKQHVLHNLMKLMCRYALYMLWTWERSCTCSNTWLKGVCWTGCKQQHFIYILPGDEDDPDKPVPDVMRLPKEGKLLNVTILIGCSTLSHSVLRLKICINGHWWRMCIYSVQGNSDMIYWITILILNLNAYCGIVSVV